ncbi:MAG: DUF1349 domain-containing protein [Spirochaetia bacterium]|jgi:regulation of enolase protein 1 (concanavalin A-like superfamily)
MENFRLTAVPAELHWEGKPEQWGVEGDAALWIMAGGRTDLFHDPAGRQRNESSPAALFTPPDRQFILSARVKVGFASDFDAGVLQIRAGRGVWAKLCFEYSPQREPMIVSVVTRGVSDDCNSVPLARTDVYLRIIQRERTSAFHYSLDGQEWRFVRYFSLGARSRLRVGFSSQSPVGAGCRADFAEIRYTPGSIANLRNGE